MSTEESWQTAIGFRSRNGRSEKELLRFEKSLGRELPVAYREFLVKTGGGYCDDALALCEDSTPFGEMNVVEFVDIKGMREMLGSFAPKHMLIIGIGHVGICTGLSLDASDFGKMYAVDTELRHTWKPERYSRLKSESVQAFYRLRDRQELPPKPPGYENCYGVAPSFNEFLEKLHPVPE